MVGRSPRLGEPPRAGATLEVEVKEDYVADTDVAIHHPVFYTHNHCKETLLFSQALEFC